VPGHQHITWSGVVFFCASLQTSSCHAADLQEIIGRGTAAIQSDWAADPDYAYVERDEVQKNDKRTSKTYKVVMIEGSDYNLPIAVNDQLLDPNQGKAELQRLKNEVQRRNKESPAARRQRIDKYTKQRDENGALLLDFPNAFTFELVREETRNGFPAYVLSGLPKKRTGPLSRAAKVLSGMRGTVWIEENFHTIRAECDVLAPVPIYGILARVLPGTHIEFAAAPVTSATWLISELSMALTVSKLLLFKSTQVTHSTYSEYRLNSTVIEELLSKANY
jgi:hypothetical protein